MTEVMVKYPYHEHSIETTYGDILPGDDASSEAYADLPKEFRELSLISDAIDKYAESKRLRNLASRSASDPEVRKKHGQKACKEAADTAEREARTIYLKSQGLLSEDATEQDLEAYDEGVQKWAVFRDTVLANPDELAALEYRLEQKLEQFRDSL